tara:strand:+ start:538 stop:789 length:252 start_codon:yes stop_codon:yes gene_type:complete
MNDYIVLWKTTTGPMADITRSGQPTTKELAEAWAEYGNQKYPDIKHRAEKLLPQEWRDGMNGGLLMRRDVLRDSFTVPPPSLP